MALFFFSSRSFSLSLSLLLSCLFFFAPEDFYFCQIQLGWQFKLEFVGLVVVFGWFLGPRRFLQLIVCEGSCWFVTLSGLCKCSRKLGWLFVFLSKFLSVEEHFNLHREVVLSFHLQTFDIPVDFFLLLLVLLLLPINLRKLIEILSRRRIQLISLSLLIFLSGSVDFQLFFVTLFLFCFLLGLSFRCFLLLFSFKSLDDFAFRKFEFRSGRLFASFAYLSANKFFSQAANLAGILELLWDIFTRG